LALLLGDVSKSISSMENDIVEPATIVCPWRIRKRGAETKLLLQAGGTAAKSKPDPYLVRAIARAHVWNRQLINGRYASGREIARAEGVTARYIYKLLPLAFLAPDIVEAISQGRQPGDLTLRSLTKTNIPDDWAAQRRRFGFSPI
jgi:site-specific DNA recombinase